MDFGLKRKPLPFFVPRVHAFVFFFIYNAFFLLFAFELLAATPFLTRPRPCFTVFVPSKHATKRNVTALRLLDAILVFLPPAPPTRIQSAFSTTRQPLPRQAFILFLFSHSPSISSFEFLPPPPPPPPTHPSGPPLPRKTPKTIH